MRIKMQTLQDLSSETVAQRWRPRRLVELMLLERVGGKWRKMFQNTSLHSINVRGVLTKTTHSFKGASVSDDGSLISRCRNKHSENKIKKHLLVECGLIYLWYVILFYKFPYETEKNTILLRIVVTPGKIENGVLVNWKKVNAWQKKL